MKLQQATRQQARIRLEVLDKVKEATPRYFE